MIYEVLLERDDRILRLGWEKTKEEAEQKMLNYLNNSNDRDFSIWVEKEKENKCKDCIHYDDTLTFPDTGWCSVWQDYMKADDDYDCDSWEDEDD